MLTFEPAMADAQRNHWMTRIASTRGHAVLTSTGKHQIGLAMYAKGKAFLAAYLLLHGRADSESVDYVALQNLCQGIEVTLKGLLLLRDYARYKPQLKPIGHHLKAVTAAAVEAYGLRPLKAAVTTELDALSNLYSYHLLRYGSGYDILVDPRTIPRQHVLRKIRAAIRLTEREFKRSHLTVGCSGP